jgi:hypothetical protein
VRGRQQAHLHVYTCACRLQKAVQGISGNTNPEIHLEEGAAADVPLLRGVGAALRALDEIAAGIGEVCMHPPLYSAIYSCTCIATACHCRGAPCYVHCLLTSACPGFHIKLYDGRAHGAYRLSAG